MLTTIDLFYLIMCEDLHEEKYIEIAFGGGPVTYGFTLHLRIRDHYMILEVCWDNLRILSFGLSHFNGLGSQLVCEVALNPKTNQ